MKIRTLLKSEVAILFYLALMLSILRLPTLIEPLDNDSTANAYHARLIVRGEPLYGSHHPAHHMPAVYYTYALGFLLFGDSVAAIKLLLIVWHILTVWLVYFLGKRMGNGDWRVGFLASVFFAIGTVDTWLKGTTGELELFANLPQVAAIFLVLELLRRNSADWKFVFVGMLCAITFAYKATFFAPSAVAFLLICLQAWLTRKERTFWPGFRRMVWLGIGFMFISLAVVIYFILSGVGPGLLLVFQIGWRYVNKIQSPLFFLIRFFTPFYILSFYNLVIFVVGSVGAWRMIRYGRRQKENLWLIVSGSAMSSWYVFSLLEAGVNFPFWEHYSLIVIPALSLLAAWEVVQLHNLWIIRKPASRWFASPAAWVVGLACLVSLVANFNFQVGFYRYAVGNLTQDEYFKIASPRTLNSLSMRPIVDYVEANTTREDRVYIWSDYPFYYVVDRLSPIETIWPMYADALGPPQRIFSAQTKYILLGNSLYIARPAWLLDGLDTTYVYETTLSGLDVYRRRDR